MGTGLEGAQAELHGVSDRPWTMDHAPWQEKVLTLAVDALAVARLTHLVVADTITAGPRDFLIRRAYTQADRADFLEAAEEWESPTEAVATDRHPPKLAKLLTCPWCSSVWLGMGVLVLRKAAPRLWGPLSEGLAFSQVAGILSQL